MVFLFSFGIQTLEFLINVLAGINVLVLNSKVYQNAFLLTLMYCLINVKCGKNFLELISVQHVY